jgi:flagellar M-ring protein FliF
VTEFFNRAIKNFLEFFNNLEAPRKIGFFVTAFAVVGGLILIFVWALKTQYSSLYTNLNAEDAKKIALILEEKKVPYAMSEDGKTIQIPRDKIDQWRLHLATLGTNFSGTLGYEVLDKQNFGTTSFVQKINRKRALEGELVKTITYLRGVLRARVHLSIPESSPFVSEQKPPAASVVLELDRGVELSASEVRGIASLVSGAVEGMRPENVVIINDRGKKLSENIGDPLTESTANQMALEAKLSRQYEEKIEEIISKIVGLGKVVAKVSLTMDFTEKLSTKTSYDSENPAILSEVKNIQNMDGKRPSPQGIPGSRSNLPGELPQPGIPETSNVVNKELTTRNYTIPSVVTKEKKPSASVARISAAVMLDGKRVPQINEKGKVALKDGKEVLVYEAWSPADIENFKAIVSSTLGLDEKRGDNLTIKSMEFVKEDVDGAATIMKENANRELIKNIVMYLAIGLAITLFFFLVVKPFIGWVTDSTLESIEDFLPKTIEELEKVQVGQKLPGLEEVLPEIEEKINPAKIEGKVLKEKIIASIESNPSKAAQIIHDMLHSTDSKKQIA